MDKFVIDQAEGLRRLLAREGSRVVAVTGGAGSPGRTTAVVNLAAALTAQGKDVLVIDECLGPRSVCSQVGGVRGAGSFAAVMRGERTLEEAVGRHALGFGVLAASRDNRAQYTAAQLRKVISGPADIVLIDAQLDAEGALSPLAMHAHDVLIVMRIGAQSITDAYACMKRLHFAHAIAQFRVLANHVANASDAQTAIENLAGVASRYLSVSLESAGSVAADQHMAQALRLARCIVDAFPSTAAARDFRHVAAELPHWPMRPAVSACSPATARAAAAFGATDEEHEAAGHAPADEPDGALQAGVQPHAAHAANAAHSTLAANADSFVAAVTGVHPAPNATSAAAPAHVGWRTDTPAQRTSPQHV
ncbi:flagellar biosynthesis protein FlhG [Paraburkholderia silvatlantica]|uniref:Flagellar biosynthesis protein FlhG n=1 Tax=Paraburkholderia silvatlantica TaxID=321895 RepID=A0A2U1A0K8_9BURK|nr:flagellar biosynthesis protein FlhG [Paraburkholderia silvatlantica]PVY24835.1 flagellar biosynthesis protein FlhG [Paraburkholderia silvatlantica]PXW31947.1 flagellar biosynthesis protein FlhG [Paraburkholderia silvatlantica]PYE22804.1 flagellar biosynthesis protein FlhG [Paraburkholderia silvatlantica]